LFGNLVKFCSKTLILNADSHSVPGESLSVPQACLRCLQVFSTLH
jgi:hypothetical protein